MIGTMSPIRTTNRASTTREAIFAAATALFLERGYARTSVRDIAGAAGIDAALVIRHFGSKERLFIDVMAASGDQQLPFEGEPSALGERLIRSILEADDRMRGMYLALIRAGDTQLVGSALRTMHETAFVGPLAHALGGTDAEFRARLIASVIGGLMYSLWLVPDEKLAATPIDELVAAFAPLVQHIVDR